MKKRIIIGTVISISMCFIFIIANLYIDYNLRKYSVYYAHNIVHKEGTHPEMAMALENMDAIYKPNKKNIRYRDDGGFIIYNTFSNSERVIMSCDPGALYKEIYKNFGFLVEANVNRKPRINLQKQFNKKYYKRFN